MIYPSGMQPKNDSQQDAIHELPTLITGYSNKFHASVGAQSGVYSPIGVWILLALVAPKTGGEDRASIETALGCDAHTAFQYATQLLSETHTAVSTAAVFWSVADTTRFSEWKTFHDSLPPSVACGPMPTQQQANAWTQANTRGLIERFPIDVETALLVLANALVAQVSWDNPFDDYNIERLNADHVNTGMFQKASKLLAAPWGHDRMLVRTKTCGIVGMHGAYSKEHDLYVCSVIANEQYDATKVHAAANEVVNAKASGTLDGVNVSLFSLSADEMESWNVTEKRRMTNNGSGNIETIHAILPEWEANNVHEIQAAPGVSEALRFIHSLVDVGEAIAEAKQAVKASYTKTGFEAAAVTTSGTCRGIPIMEEVVERALTLCFNRPYAVVAIASQEPNADPNIWDGAPVFSGWITEEQL